MPDNLPGSEGAPHTPSSFPNGTKTSSGPVNRLPAKKGFKPLVTVLLSSVGRMPSSNNGTVDHVVSATKQVPPPLLPGKEGSALTKKRLIMPAPVHLHPSSNHPDEIKLPPKTGGLPVLNSAPTVPGHAVTPPPLPAKRLRSIVDEAKRPAPVKLGDPVSGESIFSEANRAPVSAANPPGWKHLEPGELPAAADDLQSLEAFTRSKDASKSEKSADFSPIPSVQPEGAKEEIHPPPLPPPLPLAKAPAESPVVKPTEKVALPPRKLEKKATPPSSVELPATANIAPSKAAVAAAADAAARTPASRAARARKRRLVSTIFFYVLFLGVVLPAVYLLGIHFGRETRVEGQVIPPPGMQLSDEVWIVSDFRELASGIASDLADKRAPVLQEIQERQDHVQHAQADIAAREERIRLIQEEIDAAKDEIASMLKQAHDASQRIWDGPGASLENEYQSRLNALQAAISDRAKSLKLNYQPDPTYSSPEVWANAYRLALYETPPGVDGVKEHQWIEDQLTAWRAFTKTYDDRKQKLQLQAASVQLSPIPRVNDLTARMDDLQHRIDSTLSEEDPLKAELQQAQTDLSQSQTEEASLDAQYYKELYALPESSITKHLPLAPNGRFTWSHLENDSPFAEGEKAHDYWLFSRATRADGRQYWALIHFSIDKDSTLPIMLEPSTFVSTKAILRPDLSPDEQQQ